jgi:hypothetical protein
MTTKVVERSAATNGAVARPSGRAQYLDLVMVQPYPDLIHTDDVLPHGRATAPISQRNIPVFLRRVPVAFVLEQREGADEFGSGLRRLDHFVDEAALGGDVRV